MVERLASGVVTVHLHKLEQGHHETTNTACKKFIDVVAIFDQQRLVVAEIGVKEDLIVDHGTHEKEEVGDVEAVVL